MHVIPGPVADRGDAIRENSFPSFCCEGDFDAAIFFAEVVKFVVNVGHFEFVL